MSVRMRYDQGIVMSHSFPPSGQAQLNARDDATPAGRN